MKYKRKQITKIKEQYGVSGLHFYKGQIYNSNKNRDTLFLNSKIIICSKRKLYKQKRLRDDTRDVVVNCKLTATELLGLLESLENNFLERRVWFESTKRIYTDITELKQDFLILSLSGLL